MCSSVSWLSREPAPSYSSPFCADCPSTTTTNIADGVVTVGQRTLLELEDLARGYRHPCIVDIKIGYRTWYPEAGDEAYIARCKCVGAGPPGGCRHYWACQPWQCLARETLVCSSNPAPLLPLSMANPPPCVAGKRMRRPRRPAWALRSVACRSGAHARAGTGGRASAGARRCPRPWLTRR